MSVIQLGKDLVARCGNCDGQLWHNIVDKPDFKTIIGMRCIICGQIIEIVAEVEDKKEAIGERIIVDLDERRREKELLEEITDSFERFCNRG